MALPIARHSCPVRGSSLPVPEAADRQAEIDALRAKRAFEEGERAAREKERRDLEHKQKVLKDMEEAR